MPPESVRTTSLAAIIATKLVWNPDWPLHRYDALLGKLVLVAAFACGAAVVLLVHMAFGWQIEGQEGRNSLLKAEIAKLDSQIKEIDKRRLQREVGTPNYDGLRLLAVDEVAVHKGHTYLTTVLDLETGELELVNAGVLGHIPEAVSNMLGLAQKNTERLVLLVNDILDIEKLELGEARLQALCAAC